MADPESALLSGVLTFDSLFDVNGNGDSDHEDEDDGKNDDDSRSGGLSGWDHCNSRTVSEDESDIKGKGKPNSAESSRAIQVPSFEHEQERDPSHASPSPPSTSTATRLPSAKQNEQNTQRNPQNTRRNTQRKTKTKTKCKRNVPVNVNLDLIEIHAPLLFDSLARVLLRDQVVWVERGMGIVLRVCKEGEEEGGKEGDEEGDEEELGGRITRKRRRSRQKENVNINIKIEKIVLGEGTVLLPGLVDVHVHLFLHPYTETPWTTQLTREPLAERVVRATVHAKKTLLSGFTSVRDLGTEGALDADLALRSCMGGRTPLIPGPRYYCATRAIVASGAYGPKNPLYPAQDGVDGIVGAVSADGVDGCVREVRRQIGTGADWIKIYADYTPLSQTPLSAIAPTLASRVIPTFEREELKAMVGAAHRWGVKVAVHANSAGVVREVVQLGVDSVEHGGGIGMDEGVLRELAWGRARAGGEGGKKGGKKTVWVPTLAAYYTMSLSGTKKARKQWEMCERTFRMAVGLVLDDDDDDGDDELECKDSEDSDERTGKQRRMDNIAVGGDTGVFAHGQNALEMVLMRRLGASWERVLAWATIGGWKCVRGLEWEGKEGRERVRGLERRAGRVARVVWGCGGDEEEEGGNDNEEEDDDDDDEDKDEDDIELDRGVPFGVIRPGWAADLVAVKGKVDGTPEEFERALMHGVDFVMKGGVVYKRDGREVV